MAGGLISRGFTSDTRGTELPSAFEGDSEVCVWVDGEPYPEHWGAKFWEPDGTTTQSLVFTPFAIPTFKGGDRGVPMKPAMQAAVDKVKDGTNASFAAKKTGVNITRLITNLRRHGIAYVSAKGQQKQVDAAMELVKNGVPLSSAAAQTGVTYRGVYASLQRAGLLPWNNV